MWKCANIWCTLYLLYPTACYKDQTMGVKIGLLFIFNIYFSKNIKYLKGIFGELFCDQYKTANN